MAGPSSSTRSPVARSCEEKLAEAQAMILTLLAGGATHDLSMGARLAQYDLLLGEANLAIATLLEERGR